MGNTIIRNIAFDLGGVVIALSYEQAVKRFEEIGLCDARKHLDAFCQKGIFGDLEKGMISPEEFRAELSLLVGHELSHEECRYAWHGYVEAVPQKKGIYTEEFPLVIKLWIDQKNSNPIPEDIFMAEMIGGYIDSSKAGQLSKIVEKSKVIV